MKKILYILVSTIIFTGPVVSQWQSDVRLTNDTSESASSYFNTRTIAANGNTLHVVWYDFRNGNWDIYYKRSTNNGTSWGSDTKINDSAFYAVRPSISVSGSFVHVVWADTRQGNQEEIYYKRSTNGGTSWGSDVRITNDTFLSSSACISSEGSNVNLVWLDRRNGDAEIYYKRSTDNGATWGSDVRLTNDSSVSQYPSVCQSGNMVHVVWNDEKNAPGRNRIWYRGSTDGGATWGTEVLVSVGLVQEWFPVVAVSGSYIHIAYTKPTPFNIGYVRSADNGTTWAGNTLLTNTNQSGGSVGICAIDSAVHITWTNSAGGNKEIYYIKSSNLGNTWGTEERLTSDTGVSDYSFVTATNSAVHVIWSDTRDGNSEIYYKRNLTEVFTVSGLVTYKDNNQPVTGGFVKALKYIPETAEIITVDSAVIASNGTYILTHVPKDTLDLMFYQDDDLLHFVPTYYISTIDWREAAKLIVTQNMSGINCQVYRINNQTSPFTISGEATQNSDLVITGLKDAVVYAKIGNDYKNYGVSNSNGSYTVTKLPAGSYSLTAHRYGFLPVNLNVTITNSSLSGININFGSPIGVQQVSENIPARFSLAQNYPNPFNPVTAIRFAIPKAALVKIKIYDILGRVVSEVLNQNLSAGEYETKWDASGFASGIYFYRMETADYTETKRMVLIK